MSVSGRVLVTGAAGMLGSQLLLDAPDGVDAIGTDLRAAPDGNPPVAVTGVDLCDEGAVARLFEQHGPFSAVLNPAAYTAVDKAEEEPELADRVNALAPRVLARAARAAGIPFVQVSTDFVFDGQGTRPYREDDAVDPLGVYGRTKRGGEEAALAEHPDGTCVVRTQWLYGPRGQHFPGTMLRLFGERDQLSVVDDQVGSPTTTLELSPALWDVLRLDAPAGIWHAACEGQGSWYDLASACLEESGRTGVTISPCTTDEFPRPAPRPAYSVLDCSKLAELRSRTLKPWRTALQDFFAAEAS